MNEHDELELRRKLRELPDSIEPSRDLWSEIEQRLPAKKRSPWLPLAMAACFLLVMISGSLVLMNRDQPDSQAKQQTGSDVMLSSEVPRGVATAADALLESRDQLLAELEASRAVLPAKTRVLVDENLAVIDSAIEEIHRALSEDPGNADLNRSLIAYRRSELELLQQAVDAAGRY